LNDNNKIKINIKKIIAGYLFFLRKTYNFLFEKCQVNKEVVFLFANESKDEKKII
jgi:hypothetical protein